MKVVADAGDRSSPLVHHALASERIDGVGEGIVSGGKDRVESDLLVLVADDPSAQSLGQTERKAEGSRVASAEVDPTFNELKYRSLFPAAGGMSVPTVRMPLRGNFQLGDRKDQDRTESLDRASEFEPFAC